MLPVPVQGKKEQSIERIVAMLEEYNLYHLP